jgi:hypothetical protein
MVQNERLDIPGEFLAAKKGDSEFGVLLDLAEFLVGKTSRLLEDVVADMNLPDVVE